MCINAQGILAKIHCFSGKSQPFLFPPMFTFLLLCPVNQGCQLWSACQTKPRPGSGSANGCGGGRAGSCGSSGNGVRGCGTSDGGSGTSSRPSSHEPRWCRAYGSVLAQPSLCYHRPCPVGSVAPDSVPGPASFSPCPQISWPTRSPAGWREWLHGPDIDHMFDTLVIHVLLHCKQRINTKCRPLNQGNFCPIHWGSTPNKKISKNLLLWVLLIQASPSCIQGSRL